ncbi:MAG TPA: 4Fe-4S dicluster domain-containing protein, partial [Candidatus Desulfofervidus auxilii]|nr:4Fe-4S dicluster domain-containing protein [Candidatus Desulfofervidus auxilii]
KDACTIGAVFWNDDANKPAICIHCGYCAQYCPHGVIALVKEEKINVKS